MVPITEANSQQYPRCYVYKNRMNKALISSPQSQSCSAGSIENYVPQFFKIIQYKD